MATSMENPVPKKPKLEENLQADKTDNVGKQSKMAQHLPSVSSQAVPPTLEIQSITNSGTLAPFAPPKPPDSSMFALLQQICLTRSDIRTLESNCGSFMELKNLLLGCLVRVTVMRHSLVYFVLKIKKIFQVEVIKDVVEGMQIEKIHFKRRLFLSQLGYFEFNDVSRVAPSETELQMWMNRNKPELPSIGFVQDKILQLKNGMQTLRNADIQHLVHTQNMLSRAVLPSHEFVEFLKLREKFPERVNMAIGCLMAYKILDDPNGRVYVSRISAISHDSIQFEHRPIVKIDQFIPVVEKEAIDEDAFGNWLEEMDNRHEELPLMSEECGKKRYALNIFQRTLQNGPPIIESPEIPLTYRNLVLRPEDIGVLLTGLDQQEFRDVLCGMFFVFDFGNAKGPNPNVFKIRSSSAKKPEIRLTGHWALPIADVTFEPTISQHSLPFLPPHLRSNALLHVDPQFHIGTKFNRITFFPIPQTRELIKPEFWGGNLDGRMKQLNYSYPSQEFIKSKVQQFWQALEKAKRVPFNLRQVSVLPVPKLPKQESVLGHHGQQIVICDSEFQ